MPIKNLKILALGCVMVATIACGKREFPWSITSEAIESLEIDEDTFRMTSGEWENLSGCQQAVDFSLANRIDLESASHGDLAESLVDAKRIAVGCHGPPLADLTCRVQHRFDLGNRNYGETTCTYHPDAPSPCRLVVRWDIGPESENRIQGLFCETVDPALGSCRLHLQQNAGTLRLHCGG